MASQYPDFGPFEWNPVTEDLTILGGPFTIPHILIVGSDAPDSFKRAAFKVCEGHDDQDTIYAAIRELYGYGGLRGEVLLYGSFKFSAPLACDLHYIAIKAAGYTYLAYNNSDPVIDLGSTNGVLIEGLRTDAGGIDPGLGTETVLRYWKDSKWVEYYERASGSQVSSVLLVMSAPSQNFVELPKLSIVTRVEVLVLTAFNSDGTNTISVGKSVDLDMLALPVDVSTTGPKIVLAGADLGTILSVAGGFPPVATYVAAGSAPTTGMAVVSIHWHRAF
jgi:hypothetical protein